MGFLDSLKSAFASGQTDDPGFVQNGGRRELKRYDFLFEDAVGNLTAGVFSITVLTRCGQ